MKKFLDDDASVGRCSRINAVIPQRYILAGSLFFTTMTLFGMRNIQSDCLAFSKGNNITMQWGRKANIISCGAFHLGYITGQIPSGIISDKFGARYLLLCGLLTSSFITMINPLIVTLPTWWFWIILKLGLGVAQAACIPSIFSLISNWSLSKYITSYTCLALSGAPVGSCLSLNAAYWFMGVMKSWRAAFFFWGACGLLSTLLTAAFVYSRPSKHPYISEAERKLLEKKGNSTKLGRIPWICIVRDPAIWANITGQMAYHWLITVVHTNIPCYLMKISNVRQVDVILAMTPSYLFMCTTGIISGFASDYFIRHRYMPTVFLRAIFNFVGSVGGGFVLVVVTYFGDSIQLMIIWLTVSMTFTGLTTSGLHTNIFDLTKNYAGTIEGIANSLGSAIGIFSEAVLLYVSPEYSIDEWTRLNWFTFAFCFFSSTIFFIWARTTSASWDHIERDEQDEH